MEIYLKNIGKISEASVEIKGITVIAGENNTGKSTVGKALYSVFNSFYEIQNQIRQERMISIANLLRNTKFSLFYMSDLDKDIDEYVKYIIKNEKKYKIDSELLKDDIIAMFNLNVEREKEINKKFDLDYVIKNILEILHVSDEDIFQSVINKKIDLEFNGQILNIYSNSNGVISLKIKEDELIINVSQDGINVKGTDHCLHTEAIYIDNPFVWDNVSSNMIKLTKQKYYDHRVQLEYKLFSEGNNFSVIEEIVTENKLKNIYDKIALACDGSIVRQKNNKLAYKPKNSDKTLNISNLSAGIKTFAILKTLLLNGIIEDNGTIILDEPEIHLHPEWQLLFAELIVLLHKEFHLHILLNTHSPYFLRAIQVYSAKYEVSDTCKYYLSEVMEDEKACINDVTDNIDKIYEKLSNPLQKLEDERWKID